MKLECGFILLFAAAAHAFPSTIGPSTTFKPAGRTGSWPSSTGGYSTDGYSTVGYPTEGYSTGGYSTGGYSDKSWPSSSTGGYSTTFQPAVAKKVGRFGVPEARMVGRRFGFQEESERYYPSSTFEPSSTTYQP